jgi:hypothetical protein
MTSVDTSIQPISDNSISTGTTSNSDSQQTTDLQTLYSQVQANAVYETPGEEITDINGNSTSIPTTTQNALMLGGDYGKYIVQMNKKKYSINSKNAKKAASYVYRNKYRNKYILLYVNKMNDKSNKTHVFRGICYKNNKKIIKELDI